MAAILEALDAGASLILFPEGLRNQGPEPLKPFRSGLYNIARARPDVELVPTWVANLNSVMPKGEVIPLPLMVRVIFGEPVALRAEEERHAFLARAAEALLALRPEGPGTPGAERATDPTGGPAA
jgi:1-acyl-sn-glycerol-3-phosphate acyltransferase